MKKVTPLRAIRKYCIQCVGSSKEVHHCNGDQMIGQGDENNQCYFYQYRKFCGKPSVKIIRKHCLECMGGSYKLVRDCSSVKCPVHEFRFGKYPKHAVTRQKLAENPLENAHSAPD